MQRGVAERPMREKQREQEHMAAQALKSIREPSAAIGSKLLASTAGKCHSEPEDQHFPCSGAWWTLREAWKEGEEGRCQRSECTWPEGA